MKTALHILVGLLIVSSAYAGTPAKINLYSVPGGAIADGVHRVRLCAEIQDSSSQRVDTATNTVTFSLSSGSGSFESSHVINAKNGLAMINLISPTSPGNATVSCSSSGLSGDSTDVEWISPRIPFNKFPIGVYDDVSAWWYRDFSSGIADLRAHNLDSCMMGNGKVGRWRDEQSIDDAEAAGFDLYMGIMGTVGEDGGEPGYETPDFYDDPTPTIQEARVQRDMVLDNWGSYSCIQAWYTADEPSNALLNHVEYLTEAFREEDMVRPATPVLIGKERTRNHYNQSELDVLCFDLYPAGYGSSVGDFTMNHWGYGDLNMVTYMRYITQDWHAGIPKWIVLQTHSFQTQLRQPEPEEVRCMHWLSISEGVKGYFWFIYAKRYASEWYCLEEPQQADNYNEITNLAARLKANSNLLRDTLINCQRGPDECTVTGPTSPAYIKPHITTLMKKDGTEFYAVAVNHDCQNSRNLTIDSYRFDYAKNLETDTTYALPATINFLPGDGKVFELTIQEVNAPGVPLSLAVADKTETTMQLQWQAPSGPEPVDGYKVYDDSNSLIDTVYSTNCTLDSLTPGQNYCFFVRAYNNAGMSSPSNTACEQTYYSSLPSVPDDLTIVDVSSADIEIDWEPSTDNAGVAEYDVYVNGTYQSTVTQTSFIYDCDSSTHYTFAVKARDVDGGESDLCEQICAYSCEDAAPSELIGHWRFDHGTGSTALDSSIYGNDGAISGAQWTTAGYYNGALDFDGTSDKVNVGPVIAAGSQITIAAWVKADSFLPFSSDNRILSKALGSGEQDHYWMLSTITNNGDVRLRFRLKTNGVTTTLKGSSEALATGQWYHVAAVYDGTEMKLYKNANLDIATISKSGNIDNGSNVDLLIGSNYSDYAEWDGLIDDVRVYNTALTQSEIQDIMNNINPLPGDSGECYRDLAADFNCDGTVDFADLDYIVHNWNQDAFPGLGDIIEDDTVNMKDISEFAAQWLMSDLK